MVCMQNNKRADIKMKKKIILVGGGGHCKVIMDAIESVGEFKIYGITDSSLPKGTVVLNRKVLGKDDILPALFRKGISYAFIGVGSTGNCNIRKKIYENLKRIGFKLPVIIHPKAVVSKYVELGEGTFVAVGAVINAGTRVGKNVIINTSSSIDHDCEIGDFVHVAPGVTLSGLVKVGDNVHIGTGASVVHYVTIERYTFIPAAALVYKAEDGNAVWGT